MINIAICGSINNWSIVSGMGLSTIVFFLIAIIIFLLPLSFVSAELTSTWHQEGGLYKWIKDAFGSKTAFIAIWLIFLQNLAWMPLPLMWIGYSWAFIFNVKWLNTPYYHLILSLLLIWTTAFLSLRGAKYLKHLSNYGVTLGTLVPGGILFVLGFVWFCLGKPIEISFSLSHLTTDLTKLSTWVFFPSLFFIFFGIEVSAFHSQEVKDPKRTFPKAIFFSAVIYSFIIFLSAIAIAFIIPIEKIRLFTATTLALSALFKFYHIDKLFPFFTFLIGIGIFTMFANWVSGPIRGLSKVAKQGDLPPAFRQTNKHNMPSTLIITQAVLLSVLATLFILFPNVNAVYWFLLSLTTIWYLIAYLLLFAAAIKLRYKYPHIERPFKIPGGSIGLWSICGLGFFSCLVALFFGFILPQKTLNLSILNYSLMIALGVIVICLIPWFILLFKKPSWNIGIPDEDEEIK